MGWREVQLSRDSTGTTDPDGRDLREHRNTLFDDLLVFIIHNAVNAENDKLSICAFSCMGDIVERDAWTEVDAVEAALRHEDTANQRSKFVQTSIGRAGNDRHTAGAGARRGSLGEEDAFQISVAKCSCPMRIAPLCQSCPILFMSGITISSRKDRVSR